jgi:hypothetical protein
MEYKEDPQLTGKRKGAWLIQVLRKLALIMAGFLLVVITVGIYFDHHKYVVIIRMKKSFERAVKEMREPAVTDSTATFAKDSIPE